MPSLWLALALLAADGGGGLRFEGSVAAGGGYDASLLVAPGVASAGSTMGSLSVTGGAAVDVSEAVFLYAGAVLDGARFAELPELDRALAGAEATLLVDLVGPLALALTPSASWSWYADPARSGATLAGRISLRWRPARWLALRAGYAHVLRTAADPVFGTSLDRVFGEVEFRLASRTWLSVGGFAERGDATFYEEVAVVPSSTAPETVVLSPYRAPSTTLGATLGLEQGLGAGFSLDVGATLRRTTGPEGAATGPSFSAAVVWRWD
jgi:hypothetical protein